MYDAMWPCNLWFIYLYLFYGNDWHNFRATTINWLFSSEVQMPVFSSFVQFKLIQAHHPVIIYPSVSLCMPQSLSFPLGDSNFRLGDIEVIDPISAGCHPGSEVRGRPRECDGSRFSLLELPLALISPSPPATPLTSRCHLPESSCWLWASHALGIDAAGIYDRLIMWCVTRKEPCDNRWQNGLAIATISAL